MAVTGWLSPYSGTPELLPVSCPNSTAPEVHGQEDDGPLADRHSQELPRGSISVHWQLKLSLQHERFTVHRY